MSSNMRIVIIGAGGAGITAAVEAKKKNPSAEVILIDKRKEIGYAPCAMPYVLGGEIKSVNDILEFPTRFIEEQGIRLMLNTTVDDVNIEEKRVLIKSESREGKDYEGNDDKNNDKDSGEWLNYDSLILSTGSYAFVPPIKGIDKVKYFTLKSIENVKAIIEEVNRIKDSGVKEPKAVVVGAGFIGLETAVALKQQGFKVSVVEMAPYVLPTILDEDFANYVKERLEKEGIRVFCNTTVNELDEGVVRTNKEEIEFNILILATGVRPNVELAKNIGLDVNKGVVVDEFMRTSRNGEVMNDVFACGDCIEIKHIVLNTKVLSQLATTALRTGIVAGSNSVIKEQKDLLKSGLRLEGVLNTAITKINDLVISSTGITEFIAKKNNIEFVKATLTTESREHYAPEKDKMSIKLIVGKEGKHKNHILGCQIIGEGKTGVETAQKIDLIAMMIKQGTKVDELVMMEHAYSPLTSRIIEPFSTLARICLKKIERKKGI